MANGKKIDGDEKMEDGKYRIKINLQSGEIEVEGDKEFVKIEIRELLEELNKIRDVIQEEHITRDISKQSEEIEITSERMTEINQFDALSEFFKCKKPKKAWEKALVVAYWITYKENRDEFSPSDISERLKSIGIKPPENPGDVLKKLSSAKKAYLLKGSGRGKYKLGMLGKDYVENQLPENDKK